MIATFIVAAAIGQYGGGYAGHCAHLAHGYCAGCVPAYGQHHAPAAFAADPDYYAGVVAAALRKQAAADAAAKAARDNAARLDARLARIEAALRPLAPGEPETRPLEETLGPPPGATPPTPARVDPRLVQPDGSVASGRLDLRTGEFIAGPGWKGPIPRVEDLPPDDTPPIPPTPAQVAAAPLASVLQRCDACHSPDVAAGKLVLFDADGQFKTPDLWTKVKIHQRTRPDAPKRMPPKGDPLTPAERAIVADSIKADLASITEVIKD